MPAKFKFEFKETISFGQIQFTVSVTTIPSVQEGSPECAEARKRANTLYNNLRKLLEDKQP